MSVSLPDIIAQIRTGHFPESSALLPHLACASTEQRCCVNAELAIACLRAGQQRHLELAKDLIQRAWLLSGFDERLLPVFVKIHESLKDSEAIAEAYKRVGVRYAEGNNITEALKWFSSSMYAHYGCGFGDRYQYDFEMLHHIEKMAGRYRLPPINRPPLDGRKLRVAYLVFGAHHTGSVIVKIVKCLADHHDASRFKIGLFVPESKVSDEPPTYSIHELRQTRWPVIQPISSGKDRLLDTAMNIHSFAPDILVTSAGLADLAHYFIASQFTSLKTLGLLLGPPPQFVSPKFDRAISATKHPLLDSPCETDFVKLECELPTGGLVTCIERNELNIPDYAFVFVSGGRVPKFENQAFWNWIASVLRQLPNTYYVALGIEKLPECANDNVTKEVSERIRCVSWKKEYLNVLGIADLCIDTYPSGGGVFLLEAMALGIPVIGFKNNYLKRYDQTDWSPFEEFSPSPDLAVSRGDWESLTRLFLTLHGNAGLRNATGKKCSNFVTREFGNPGRMTAAYEGIYERLVYNCTERGN
jgi:hypothetical protein